MLARQRCGGGHAGRRFLGYSNKASLVRRCIALGQTAASGLCHHQPARGGAHRSCPESRDLRQRQLSADAVRPPCSRLTAIGQHACSGRERSFASIGRPSQLPDSPAGFSESCRGILVDGSSVALDVERMPARPRGSRPPANWRSIAAGRRVSRLGRRSGRIAFSSRPAERRVDLERPAIGRRPVAA